jgi:hypothetical protein
MLQLLDGIGPRIARRIMDSLGVRPAQRAPGDKGNTAAVLGSPLTRLIGDAPKVPPAAREEFGQLRKVMAQCCGGAGQQRQPARDSASTATHDREGGDRTPPGRAKNPPLTTQIEHIRHFYEPIFMRIYDNPTVRLHDIEQLAQIAAGYRSRTRFLTDVTLDPPEATSDLAQAPFLEEDYLTLSTIHSAKGCEWTVVQIIHAADGMIPSDMAVGDEAGVEEERRLFYVAMTRAKDMLYVHYPLRYYHRRSSRSDAHNYGQRTRFLPDSVCALFERRTGVDHDEDEESRDDAAASSDPYQRASRLWRE